MCQSIWNSTCARCPQILCITICLGILPSKTLSNDITDSVILTAYAVQECNLGFTCNTSKESRSSQTIEYDTLPQTMDEARLWKKGTTEHTSLQVSLARMNKII